MFEQPRIPVRVEPYSSPARQHRHFKNKRDQILRALGKASYINGSQFAILWVNSRGDSEMYASQVFQQKLSAWFNDQVLAEAKELVAHNSSAETEAKAERMNYEDMFGPAGKEEDMSGDEELGEDDSMNMEAGPPKMNFTTAAPKLGVRQPVAYVANNQLRAQGLRRTFSMPGAMPEVYRPASAAAVAAAASLQLSQSQTHRPAPLNLSHTSNASLDAGLPLSGSIEYKPLTIGNSDEVTQFMETRFRQLQQMVCKIVSKAWIKIIEPRKQTRYPYNKGEDSRPDWWPHDVRHKEPDHLMKPERIKLLMTMLRCGKVPVNRLELATAEVGAFIPQDKTGLLKEIYRVAREEERLRNGEIDAQSKVYVASTAAGSPIAGEDVPSPIYVEPPVRTSQSDSFPIHVHEKVDRARSAAPAFPVEDAQNPFQVPGQMEIKRRKVSNPKMNAYAMPSIQEERHYPHNMNMGMGGMGSQVQNLDVGQGMVPPGYYQMQETQTGQAAIYGRPRVPGQGHQQQQQHQQQQMQSQDMGMMYPQQMMVQHSINMQQGQVSGQGMTIDQTAQYYAATGVWPSEFPPPSPPPTGMFGVGAGVGYEGGVPRASPTTMGQYSAAAFNPVSLNAPIVPSPLSQRQFQRDYQLPAPTPQKSQLNQSHLKSSPTLPTPLRGGVISFSEFLNSPMTGRSNGRGGEGDVGGDCDNTELEIPEDAREEGEDDH
ncbi:hypothetical protein YB2330_000398 [Saitoella coloradoensis]